MLHHLNPPVAESGLNFFQTHDITSEKSCFDSERRSLQVNSATAEYHDAFIGLKTPTSKGCSRCVECGGNFSIWVLF